MVSPTIEEKLQREELPVGWPWRFFLFSLLVFITALIVYLGVAFGYKPFLVSQIDKQEAAIAQLSQTIPKKQQEDFIAFYSQLVNLQRLLKDHVFASKIFPFIQANTNQLVYYTAVDLRVGEKRLELEGAAVNYGVFAQQLQALAAAPGVESLIINDSSASGGRVKFRLSLILKQSLFK